MEIPTTSRPSATSSSDEDSEDQEEGAPKKKRMRLDDNEKEDEGVKRKRQKAEKKSYQCPLCPKTFPFPNKLREHMIVHEIGRYSCSDCPDELFDNIFELRTHQKEFHSQAVHKCTLCPFVSERHFFLERHFQKNHVNGIPCTIQGCELKFAKNQLKAHIRTAHPTASSLFETASSRAKLSFEKCPRCEYRPSSEDVEVRYEELMEHMSSVHTKNSRLACKLGCGKIFPLGELAAHLDVCQNSEGVGSAATSTATLSMPTNTMTEEMDVEDLEDREDVNEEAETLEKEKDEKKKFRGEFNCETCGKEFSRSESLRRHQRCHNSSSTSSKPPTKRKEFKCERPSKDSEDQVCGKIFRTEQALKDHHNVHDDIKPYGCVTCQQRFHGRDRFAVHLSKYHQRSIKDLNANEMVFGRKKSEEKAEPSTSGIEELRPSEAPESSTNHAAGSSKKSDSGGCQKAFEADAKETLTSSGEAPTAPGPPTATKASMTSSEDPQSTSPSALVITASMTSSGTAPTALRAPLSFSDGPQAAPESRPAATSSQTSSTEATVAPGPTTAITASSTSSGATLTASAPTADATTSQTSSTEAPGPLASSTATKATLTSSGASGAAPSTSKPSKDLPPFPDPYPEPPEVLNTSFNSDWSEESLKM